MMGTILTGLVWDFLPVMLMMFFHHHNFKERPEMNDSKVDVDENSSTVAQTITNADGEKVVNIMLDYAKSKN